MFNALQDISATSEWAWNGEPLVDFSTTVDSPEVYSLPANCTSPISSPASPISSDASTWQSITQQPEYIIYTQMENAPKVINYTLSTSEMTSIAHSYMPSKNAWIIPRQNKISLNCKIEGDLARHVKDSTQILIEFNGNLVGVTKLLFSLDAIRSVDGEFAHDRAPLFIQNARKIMVAPDPVQVFPKGYPDCTANWNKLQFSTITSGNANKIGTGERFHFVISLLAHVHEGQNVIALTLNTLRSPAIIVIGQNPARFTKSKSKQSQEPIAAAQTETSLIQQSKRKRTEHESIDTTSGVFNIADGKVGINCLPYETLAVGGNILYTGEIFKPSDRRIKRNFKRLNQDGELQHLHNISQIKLYEYERMDLTSKDFRFISERGVIAQEVQQIIPTAVTRLGEFTLPNGNVIDLQAVNHQELLIETIGATQDLNTKTSNISDRVEELSETTQQHASVLQHLSTAVNYVQTTEHYGLMPSKFNIMGLGPAWTAFIVGFFFPIMFLVGALYLCSAKWHRQLAGLASIAVFTLLTIEIVIVLSYQPGNLLIYAFIYAGYMFFGVIICAAVALATFVKRCRGKSFSVVA